MKRALILSALALGAAFYFYYCGSHRFILLLSFAYTGGFEILSGKLPYRDFVFPVGPMIFVLQAAFFKLLGMSYLGGYLGHAAALNSAAACLAYLSVERRTRSSKLALAAGVLTALWYYPMSYASPNYDQESFFFLFPAVWLLEGGSPILSGVACALAFFTKQSTGAAGAVFLAVAAAQSSGWRAGLKQAAGFLAGAVFLGACFSALGGAGVFLHHFLYLPLTAGRLHFTRDPRFWAAGAALSGVLAALPARRRDWAFILPVGFGLALPFFTYPHALTLLVPLLALPLLPTPEERALLQAICLIQLGARAASFNDIRMFWPLIGFQFGLIAPRLLKWESALGLAPPPRLRRFWIGSAFAFLIFLGVRLSSDSGRSAVFPMTTFGAGAFALALAAATGAIRGAGAAARRRMLAAGGLALGGLALCARGAQVYRRRRADPEVLAGSEERRAVYEPAVAQLRGLRLPRKEAIFVESLVGALNALPLERRPYFTYPWCDIAYPLTGQPMPQPLLWFDPPLSFKPGDGSDLLVAQALRGSGVRTIVSCLDFQQSDRDLPAVAALKEGPGEEVAGAPSVRLFPVRAEPARSAGGSTGAGRGSAGSPRAESPR